MTHVTSRSRNATIIKRIKELGFTTFVKEDKAYYQGQCILVSGEEGDDSCDYYGEFRGGYPWINPKLEKLAKDVGAYWEWEHPGAIALAR